MDPVQMLSFSFVNALFHGLQMNSTEGRGQKPQVQSQEIDTKGSRWVLVVQGPSGSSFLSFCTNKGFLSWGRTLVWPGTPNGVSENAPDAKKVTNLRWVIFQVAPLLGA